MLPEPFPNLLGRHEEIDIALAALSGPGLVEIYGPCGIGKTSLLRHLAHRAVTVFPDLPVVFASAAGLALGDLLQALFALLCQADVRWRPEDIQLRHELRRAQAVLLLDDVALGSDDLADLVRAVPDCRVALACPRRRLGSETRSLGLSGLDEQASVQLAVRALGRALRDDERTDLWQLWNVLAGHPLRLLQAAALVREAGQSFAQLVGALQEGDPVGSSSDGALPGCQPSSVGSSGRSR